MVGEWVEAGESDVSPDDPRVRWIMARVSERGEALMVKMMKVGVGDDGDESEACCRYLKTSSRSVINVRARGWLEKGRDSSAGFGRGRSVVRE